MKRASLKRPRALRAGARLAVLSPASAAKRDLVERGVAHLEALGYGVTLGAHALDSGPLSYAGSARNRVEDLHAAFADPAIDGILCTRGGWGAAELLPMLDAELIRSCPKVFVGYSDITSLQTWLIERAGLVTFYGPMVAADFAREQGVDLRRWRGSLHESSGWSMGAEDGLRTLRAGVAEGALYGGCLSILAESLGTPYAPEPFRGVLFLEDIGAKPYQWDRMLVHLRYAGLLDHVSGIIFGDMGRCVEPDGIPLLQATLLHSLKDFAGPIAIGLRCGHVDGPNVTLPLGLAFGWSVTIRRIRGYTLSTGLSRCRLMSAKAMPTPKHIHLIGICGTAMAALAGMLQAQGHQITGSDAASYPPMNQLLRELGIGVQQPYDTRNLEPRPDLVIVGNAISRGNAELEYVLDHRIPFASMAAIVHDEFLAGRESLVVAGTHGKTTTTSMLAWIYEVASRSKPELAPSFLIGGVAENFGTSFRVTATRPFIIEGDEYDTAFFDKGPKFLHYFPDAAILTHVEFDHADIYADLGAVKTAFKRLVNLIPRRGRLGAC